MKIVSIILLLSFTTYAGQDSLNVLLSSFDQKGSGIKMVVYNNTELESMRQKVNYNNIIEPVLYISPYPYAEYLQVKGTSKRSGGGLDKDKSNAIRDAKNNVLNQLGIKKGNFSEKELENILNEIFSNGYRITNLGYMSKDTYQVRLSGELNTFKVLKYSHQNNSTKAAKGTLLAVLGIFGGVVVFIGIVNWWNDFKDDVEGK